MCLGAVRVFRHVDALHVRSRPVELDRSGNLALTGRIDSLAQDQRRTTHKNYCR